MTASELEEIQEAIRGESLDGWLFCNFRHRDKLSDDILRISSDTTNSRLWIYAIPARGSPRKIVHAVEPEALDALPGEKNGYVGRDELAAALKPLGGLSWGVHSSESITAVSYLDAGTAAVLEKQGLRLVSAAGLIQRFRGLIGAAGIASHERAAVHLYEIVDIAWDFVKKAYREKTRLCEGGIRSLMLDEMKKRGLEPGHPPIVASGANAGNPHYDFSGSGALIREGDVLQFDLWAREKGPEAVYGDISWVGVFSQTSPPDIEKAFGDLVSAREGALSFIGEECAAGRKVSGAAVDRKTREILTGKGYERALKHRTGHGIDTELHGSGVNMDSVEFPDSRFLLEGSCFSIEPGIYFERYGLRTEIDVYIRGGKPVVSGHPCARQSGLLTC
jgi:Xaa-Pro aminopeptidase